MTNGNNIVYKLVTTAMVGVVVSGAPFWLTLGRASVTRAEVRTMIVEHGENPHADSLTRNEAQLLIKRMDSIAENVAELRSDVKQLLRR